MVVSIAREESRRTARGRITITRSMRKDNEVFGVRLAYILTRKRAHEEWSHRGVIHMLLEASVGYPRTAHVVVLGNEKGGSGKSTACMHIAVGLLKAGQRVATIDLDSRQKSLTHYVENRRGWVERSGL